jgi:predicted DNA-binding protein (MmcQ/YjbR family)
MDFETFRNYCLAKKGVTEDYPFKGEAVWMKVKGKMFAMANVLELKMEGELVEPFHFINLKCEPEKEAEQLRESHAAIRFVLAGIKAKNIGTTCI